jgi:hypothetical protein
MIAKAVANDGRSVGLICGPAIRVNIGYVLTVSAID